MSISYDTQVKMVWLTLAATVLLAVGFSAYVVLDVQQQANHAIGIITSAIASARPAPAPSASAPPREPLHETLSFIVLTPRGREEAAARCRRRGGRPDVEVEQVTCYGTGTQRYQKLFVYTAVDAISDDVVGGGGGAGP